MKRKRFSRAAALSPAAGALMSNNGISKADAVTRQAPDCRMEIKLLSCGILAIALATTSVFMCVPGESLRNMAENARNIVPASQATDRFTTVYKSTTSPSRVQLAQAAACVKSECLDV